MIVLLRGKRVQIQLNMRVKVCKKSPARLFLFEYDLNLFETRNSGFDCLPLHSNGLLRHSCSHSDKKKQLYPNCVAFPQIVVCNFLF